MAAPLNLTSATVTLPDGTVHERVAVRLGNNTIRLTRGMTVIDSRDKVVAMERNHSLRRQTWVVRFDDGTEWHVERSKQGCRSCGH